MGAIATASLAASGFVGSGAMASPASAKPSITKPSNVVYSGCTAKEDPGLRLDVKRFPVVGTNTDAINVSYPERYKGGFWQRWRIKELKPIGRMQLLTSTLTKSGVRNITYSIGQRRSAAFQGTWKDVSGAFASNTTPSCKTPNIGKLADRSLGSRVVASQGLKTQSTLWIPPDTLGKAEPNRLASNQFADMQGLSRTLDIGLA